MIFPTSLKSALGISITSQISSNFCCEKGPTNRLRQPAGGAVNWSEKLILKVTADTVSPPDRTWLVNGMMKFSFARSSSSRFLVFSFRMSVRLRVIT